MPHTRSDIYDELRRLDAKLGIDTRYITLTISNRATKRYGCCVSSYSGNPRRYVPKEIRISAFMLNEEEALWDTVRHEYAHAVAAIRSGKNHGHDAYWKRICVEVGARPERLAPVCESQQKVYQIRPTKYEIRCNGCGAIFRYTKMTKFVKAVMTGKAKGYHHKQCGSHDFTLLGTTEYKEEPDGQQGEI